MCSPRPPGSQYEAALRKQHSALNPRTSWASRDAAKRQAGAKRDRRRGFGADDSDEGEEQQHRAGGDADELEEDEAAEQLLQCAGGLLRPSRQVGGASARLAPGILETSRLKDANQHEPHESVVRSVEFHPDGQLLMTAGLDKRIRLFQVRFGAQRSS